MLRCAIVGATGYTGMELIRILLRHPGVQLTALTTRQKESIPVRSLMPELPPRVDLVIRSYSTEELKRSCDMAFLCLPHTEAMETGSQLYRAGKWVVDLSADFRLRDWKNYEAWYGVRHTQKALLKKAVYGLPEIFRNEIRKARLIANPGCYPTGAILGIYPLLASGLVDANSIVIDSKSGVSGAGKKLTASSQFCELEENFYAYKVHKHQHTPEIEEVLSRVKGRKLCVTFVTHLLPVKRGILSTIYLQPKRKIKPGSLRRTYESFYGREPFIRLNAEGSYPSLRDVRSTNFCDIGMGVNTKTNRIVVVTAIDNLVKGASGQAVQNMNLCCGFPEEEGLISW